MSSLAIERLEALLQTRKLDRTLARGPALGPARLTSGLDHLDAKLGGGWPQGEVSEIVGRTSSGRTGILVSTLAAATRLGGIVGLVDTFDRFDPVSAARAGLDLDRVLWVRGPALTPDGRSAFGTRLDDGREKSGRRAPFTPDGHALFEPGRRAPFRVDDVALRNAIRALDLIVRAGGFAVAALDLADAPARAIAALPFTTWHRLAHANEGRDTVCLLMGETPMGRSARGQSVRLDSRRRWSGTRPQSRRFLGFEPAITVGEAVRPVSGADAVSSRA